MTAPSLLPRGWSLLRANSLSMLRVFAHLYWRGALLGLRSLSWGHVKCAGLKRTLGFILQPVENWSRYPELFSVVEMFPLTSAGQTVLDVGSPKGLGLCLAQERAGRFVLTDIWHVAVREVEVMARKARLCAGARLELAEADALELRAFPEASVDVLFSVSVLEHIPLADGLVRALREFARVLRPGGTCLVTLPIRPEFCDEFLNRAVYSQGKTQGEPQFFSHYYDLQSIKNAVAAAHEAGMLLEGVRVVYWRERWLPLRIWKRVPQKVRGFLGVVNLLLAPWSFRVSAELPSERFAGAGDVVLKWRRAVG